MLQIRVVTPALFDCAPMPGAFQRLGIEYNKLQFYSNDVYPTFSTIFRRLCHNFTVLIKHAQPFQDTYCRRWYDYFVYWGSLASVPYVDYPPRYRYHFDKFPAYRKRRLGTAQLPTT